jgi:hypothetical protein
MTKIERAIIWLTAVMLVLSGVFAVITRTLPQGKFFARVDSIYGFPAILFGCVFVAVGVYFIRLLLKEKPSARGKKLDSPAQAGNKRSTRDRESHG